MIEVKEIKTLCVPCGKIVPIKIFWDSTEKEYLAKCPLCGKKQDVLKLTNKK